ncbi:MAG: energy transducer TonB, partial [Luteibaculum sp.]
ALKLSDAQMQLLNNLDYGTGLKVNVDFEQKNTVTNALEVKNMEIYLNVIPHAEANFPAGKEALRMYLRDRIANSVYGKLPANFDRAVVWFSINEAGECVEINTAKSSGNEEADQILKEALRSMPKWNPARDEHGKPVIQEFNFTFGDQGC